MSKVYSSNLTKEQWELIEPLIPRAKTGGRKREVDIWCILNAIFYVLTQGCTLCINSRMYMAKLTRRLSPMANCIYIFPQLATRWDMD
ncbi:transposase [Cylindrospermopsis raciborskii KLL07]|jgi:transposase|nr:transposase [Cylindrospermopsis raciborskii]UJS05646.1 transposase [Cylindrospermopsis raciborskii KLL07]